MRNQQPPVSFLGNPVPWGGSIIHFYYSPFEQARSAAFLWEALQLNQVAVLGCTLRAYQVMAEALLEFGIAPSDHRIHRIEVAAKLVDSVRTLCEVAQQASAAGKAVRMVVDFGEIVPPERLAEAEAPLSAMAQGLQSVCLTQYDGRVFGATVTIEQFRTHALAIVGNVLYHENRQYTRPEEYLRFRASAGSKS